MSLRRTSLAVTVVGGVAAALLAALLLPWRPVPGGMPDPVPAGEVFTAAELARAEAYARAARAWSWSGLATGLAVAVLLALSARPGRRLRRLLDRLPGPPAVAVPLAGAVVLTTLWLVALPFALGAWSLRRDVGLATQSVWLLLRDQLVWHAITVGVAAVLLAVLGVLVRRLPRAWPAVAGAALAVLTMLSSWVWPVLVEPAFNDFRPLPDGTLRTAVLAAAEREGVPVREVLVADASRRTTALNAYVSGYGSTRRVVLYDTLVAGSPEPEVVSIAAHELAHARYDDPLVGTVIGAAGAVAAGGLLGLVWSAPGVRRRWGPPDGRAAVPLLVLLAAAGPLLVAPLTSTASRLVETRADVTALRTTGDPATFVRMQRSLALRNLSDPTPPAWSQVWFGTHPTVLQRIAVARQVGAADPQR